MILPMTLIPLTDCGNSPKNQLIHNLCLEFLSAFADPAGPPPQVLAQTVGWTWTAGGLPEGAWQNARLVSAISHGMAGAVEFVLEDGSRRQKGCLVLEFATAACKKLVRADVYWQG